MRGPPCFSTAYQLGWLSHEISSHIGLLRLVPGQNACVYTTIDTLLKNSIVKTPSDGYLKITQSVNVLNSPYKLTYAVVFRNASITQDLEYFLKINVAILDSRYFQQFIKRIIENFVEYRVDDSSQADTTESLERIKKKESIFFSNKEQQYFQIRRNESCL